jgi:hypothetical protein
MMRLLPNYTDSNGLIVQSLVSGGDGGDSCNRTCTVALAEIYQGKTTSQDFLKELIHPKYPFILRRHPNPEKWYSDWDRASRDQTIPYIILLGETKSYRLLSAYFLGHLLRGLLFTTNIRRNHVYKTLEEHQLRSTPDVKWNYSVKLPDFTAFEFFALYIRALPKPLRVALYPLLLIGDLETLLSALAKRFITPKDDDISNHALVMINGMRRTPTIFLKLAAKVAGAQFINDRLLSFFGKDIEPPIDEMLKETVNKYL